MSPDDFRNLALALPEAVEGAHMGHADFRIRGKIFATLGYPDAGTAMVKLPLELQEVVAAARPGVFAAVPGYWGRKGATYVWLAAADAEALRDPLQAAWRGVAPKRLAATLGAGG